MPKYFFDLHFPTITDTVGEDLPNVEIAVAEAACIAAEIARDQARRVGDVSVTVLTRDAEGTPVAETIVVVRTTMKNKPPVQTP